MRTYNDKGLAWRKKVGREVVRGWGPGAHGKTGKGAGDPKRECRLRAAEEGVWDPITRFLVKVLPRGTEDLRFSS